MEKISFVIPAFNSQKTIAKSLSSIEKSIAFAEIKDFEIIVIDDYSREPVDLPSAKVIRQPKNLGPAAARNKGFKESTGEIVFFLDSDIVIPEDYVKKVMSTFHELPDYDAITTTYSPVHQTSQFFSLYKNLYMYYHLNSFQGEVSFLLGAATAMRRESFMPFREYIRFGEDTDLAQRMTKEGKRLYFLENTSVEHLKEYDLISFFINNYKIPFNFCRSFLELEKTQEYTFSHASKRQVLSIALSGVILLFLFVSPLISMLLTLFFILMNSTYYAFIQSETDKNFAMKAIPVHLLDCMVMGFGILNGLIWFRFSSQKYS